MEEKYDVTIGLEVHIEIKTKSKMFSPAKNEYSELPNSNITEIDLGFPGILPSANKEAIKKAVMMALALNCQLPPKMYFDRKNYYYPDLPKGYQITQTHDPVGTNGYIDVYVNDVIKRIHIHDIHLEEDTASLDHFDEYSLIDYNRAGVPLLETVTEPCIHSAEEALAFLDALRRIFLYCNISEARTDRGQIRCDVNISLAPKGSDKLGTKVEMKNINSFSNVKAAIEYEIKRQSEMLDNKQSIIMETRRFDDNAMKTYHMREKVENLDYKYFVEPNIPPFKLTEAYIEKVKSQIPMLQFARINKYINDYELSLYDATIITKNLDTALYFEEVISKGIEPKIATNWINTRILGHINKEEISISKCSFKVDDLVELINYLNQGTISTKQAKDIFYKCLEENKKPSQVIKENKMEQITNVDEIAKIVKEVMEQFEEIVKTYDPTKDRVLDFFVGQVMKKTRGQANPMLATQIIKQELEKR